MKGCEHLGKTPRLPGASALSCIPSLLWAQGLCQPSMSWSYQTMTGLGWVEVGFRHASKPWGDVFVEDNLLVENDSVPALAGGRGGRGVQNARFVTHTLRDQRVWPGNLHCLPLTGRVLEGCRAWFGGPSRRRRLLTLWDGALACRRLGKSARSAFGVGMQHPALSGLQRIGL